MTPSVPVQKKPDRSRLLLLALVVGGVGVAVVVATRPAATPPPPPEVAVAAPPAAPEPPPPVVEVVAEAALVVPTEAPPAEPPPTPPAAAAPKTTARSAREQPPSKKPTKLARATLPPELPPEPAPPEPVAPEPVAPEPGPPPPPEPPVPAAVPPDAGPPPAPVKPPPLPEVPPLPTTILRLALEDELGSWLRLTECAMFLDGKQVVAITNPDGIVPRQVHLTKLVAGRHSLKVRLTYLGQGRGVFSYLEGYKFTLKDDFSFVAAEGVPLKVTVVGADKGDMNSEFTDRPTIRFTVR